MGKWSKMALPPHYLSAANMKAKELGNAGTWPPEKRNGSASYTDKEVADMQKRGIKVRGHVNVVAQSEDMKLVEDPDKR